MSTTEKTRAIELAEANEAMMHPKVGNQLLPLFESNATELRRQHGEIEGLRAKNEELTHKADDLAAKNEELRAQVEALSKQKQISVELDFKQVTELLEMFGGEPGLVTLMPGDGHSGPGLYAAWSEVPEEGAVYLGATDDEASPQPLTRPAVPEGWEQVEAIAVARYKVAASDQSMFHRHAVVAGDGKQQLYLGREVECEIMARKFANAFLDGAFVAQGLLAAPQPAPTVSDSLTVAPQPEQVAGPVVPEFIPVAQKKLNDLLADGFQVTGFAIQRNTTQGFIDSAGFVGWWTPGIHALAMATIDAMERPAVPEGWRKGLLDAFPLLKDAGLDEDKHHCEWVLQQDRKRLHAMLAAAPQPEGAQKGGA